MIPVFTDDEFDKVPNDEACPKAIIDAKNVSTSRLHECEQFISNLWE